MTAQHMGVHLHCYQPDRRDPVTGLYPVQESAVDFGRRFGKNYSNWNEAVCDRSYRPLGNVPILENGRFVEHMNVYRYASFNFGATLLDWMALHATDVLAKVIEGDRFSVGRTGHGNAVAQCYNHLIMPLATVRDQRVQVVWGIRNFEHYFGRLPSIMWLPECGVDHATLRTLFEKGVRVIGTVLSPHQAWRIREDGSHDWQEVNERIDPSRPYKYEVGPGQFVTIVFYDKPVSQAVAFEHLTDDGKRFLDRLYGAFNSTRWHDQFVLVATDGETYGHHVPFGDMALGWVLKQLSQDPRINLTNPAAFVADHPATAWVQLHEPSAWSCPHGVGRWERNCGCQEGGQPGWNQEWRYPLRQSLNWLKSEIDRQFEAVGCKLFRVDPWDALEEYITVLTGETSPEEFVRARGKSELGKSEIETAHRLLEMERFGQLMFTSCGWYFTELSGIETVQNLESAAQAMFLAHQNEPGLDLESDFLERFAKAQSNINVRLWRGIDAPSRLADGRDIWESLVRPKINERRREGALAA